MVRLEEEKSATKASTSSRLKRTVKKERWRSEKGTKQWRRNKGEEGSQGTKSKCLMRRFRVWEMLRGWIWVDVHFLCVLCRGRNSRSCILGPLGFQLWFVNFFCVVWIWMGKLDFCDLFGLVVFLVEKWILSRRLFTSPVGVIYKVGGWRHFMSPIGDF